MCGVQRRSATVAQPVATANVYQAHDASCQTSPMLACMTTDTSFTLTNSFTETAVSTSQIGERETADMQISITSRSELFLYS